MEISIFDYIRNASDETLMEMAELAQAEQRKREEQKEAKKKILYFQWLLVLGLLGYQ